ncbi:MAG: histidinol phosphatase [Propionibacteriaceae bacterium]|jgi:histidinol-phosphatase|nr:histidinol phosphatase [Propionibacteriaceae bacterium]
MARSNHYTDDLRLAHLLADKADSITTSRFRAQNLRVSAKPDLTVVSDADTTVEQAIRQTLSSARPRDAVHGEEMADSGWGPRRWIIDPIDGTANFVRGVPVWASLIALMDEGEVKVGLVSAPLLGRRWWAAAEQGAFSGRSLLQSQSIRVSARRSIEDAFVSYSSLHGWVDCGRGRQFGNLLRLSARTRAFGDFWSHMLVAEGAVDLACEPELALHDMAALDVIVRQAGGRFSSIDGQDGPHGPGALASNGLLHEAVLDLLAPDDNQEDSLIIPRRAAVVSSSTSSTGSG